MPYIKVKDRLECRLRGYPQTVGELNYMFTDLIIQYQKHKKLSYQTVNDIVGALESCKQEYYRRVASSYEDKKKRLNGDIYS